MIAFALLAVVASATPVSAPPDSVIDLDEAFEAFDATGSFVLYDAVTGQSLRHNPAGAATRESPASTYKVYNALVALETGVVAPILDSVQFEWDGTVRRVEGWNEDQSLRTAMQRSTVWVFQEIARRVGGQRYRAAFGAEPFGNGDMSCGLDVYWLNGCLRVSADEQVAFLDRLRRGETAFRPEVEAAVRELILLESEPTYHLYGKTGWAVEPDGSELGWIVGWVERSGRAHVYALNVESDGPAFDMRAARHGVLFEVLERMGLRPHRPTDPRPTAAPAPDDRGDLRSPPLPRRPVAPADEWIARDKALHFGVSFLMTLATQYVLTSKASLSDEEAVPFSAALTLAAGLGKEAVDSSRGNFPTFSWRDLAADALGIALAALVVVL